MIKSFKSIQGEKVRHFHTGESLALLSWPIIDPDTGVIEAFWVKPLTLAMRNGIILTSNILAFKKNVYIRSDEVIVNPAEVIRIASILDDGRQFLNAHVQSEKGRQYGRIYDLCFSTETYVLRQIYCKKFFLGALSYDRRSFPYERILKVLPKKVIIDDDTTKKEKVVEAPAELA